MGFLTAHAQLAWKSAVHNCMLILDGLVDLEQKKCFVSSFQNAIELCLKQYLLDKNDISILHSKMNNPSNHNQYNIYINCSSSSDYNAFFTSLSPTDLNNIYTSDFVFIYK